MKPFIFLIALLFLSFKNYSQIPFDSTNQKYFYEGVVTIKDSISKEEIYKKAKNWLVVNLKSADNMVELDDKEFNSLTGTGILLLKDRHDINSMINCKLSFKVSIYCKDGRFKYVIGNFTHYYTYRQNTNPPKDYYHEKPLEKIKVGKKRKEKILEEIHVQINALIDSLVQSINTKSETDNDNW